MDRSEGNSREYSVPDDFIMMKIKDIKEEDGYPHSGLDTLAAAAADETLQSPANSNNKHTNRKTGADMKIFLSYLASVNEMRQPQDIPEAELDKHLCTFFMVVRKTDKTEYEPCSLRSMLASIERYLKINGYPASLTKDIAFTNTRHTLKVKQKILREMGKGAKQNNTFNVASLKDKTLDRAFEAREMGPYSPASISQTLCFVFVVYLKLRKATEHKKLLWGDVILDRDQNGREYITFSEQMLQRCTLQYLKQCQPVVYALPDTPDRDPVRIYKLYASKRAPTMNYQYAPFYLGINVFNPNECQSWYKTIAMGINKLNDMVRQVREITGMTPNAVPLESTEAPQDLSLPSSEKHSKTVIMKPNDNGNQYSHEDNPMTDTKNSHHDVKDEKVELKNGEGKRCIPKIERLLSSDCRNVLKQESWMEDDMIENKYQTIDYDVDESDDETEDEEGNMYIDESEASLSDVVEDGGHLDERQKNLSETESLVNYVSLTTAQKQFVMLINQLNPDDVTTFKQWFKNLDIIQDKQTGKLVCKEQEEKEKTNNISNTDVIEQQIVLNITLSNRAFKGEAPVTVTATTMVSNQNNSPTNKDVNSNIEPMPTKTISKDNMSAQCIDKTSIKNSTNSSRRKRHFPKQCQIPSKIVCSSSDLIEKIS
ncbi:uncharacterized protein LOC126811391 [Patella vulgata]|uniref:uncharacterized protein LOC126811391 n=1 Tax=Patella vulgata TaxID=6465 RepID=UPI00217F576E|nr:uncharacterized protein LOC126811391 [Patella vulgata]